MKTKFNIINALLLFLVSTLVISCHKNQEPVSDNTSEKDIVLSNHLSNQKIKSICEDQYGQIWIGTFRGLNKYDGTKFHQYFCVDDSLGLPDNNISEIFKDSKNRLWIATVNGVCLYNEQGNFTRVGINYANKFIGSIHEDKKGRIFFFSSTDIYQYDEKTQAAHSVLSNKVEKYSYNINCHIDDNDVMWIITPFSLKGYRTKDFKKIADCKIHNYPQYSCLIDGHELYLSYYGGLQLFNTHTRKMQPLPDGLQAVAFPHDIVNNMHTYRKKDLLFSTNKHGMLLYLTKEKKVITESDKDFPFEMPDVQVTNIFTDRKGNLWLGTDCDGIRTIYRYQDMFNSNLGLQRAIGNQPVLSVGTDKTNHLWVSTKREGIYIYDLKSKAVKKIPHNNYDDANKKNEITYIYVDADNYIWLANVDKLLKCQYNGEHLNIVATYPIFMPMDITQDKAKNIWVTTASVNIYSISAQDGKVSKKQLFPTSFTFIPSMLCMKNGNMMISAFYKPILEMSGKTYDIKEFKFNDNDWKSCIKRSVYIPTKNYEDSKGNLWLGTVSNGLLKYDTKTKKLQRIKGLSCSDIASIEEDKMGNLWISTMYGLNKLDTKTEKVTTYNEADGIGGFQFYDRASCQLPDGTLVFGGTHGLTIFNPLNVTTNHNISLLFETLKVHNEIVQADAKENIIKESMEQAPHISLGYKQNSFSVSFAAIDYSEYNRIHYFYKMDGFDKTWIDAGSNNEAYYSNLPAGCYTFKVKIVGNDTNTTLAEKAIKVSIAPEPWNSWWARCLYLMVTCSAIYFLYRTRKRINEEKQMARKAEEEKEQEQRINKMNMSFFANISHEFRTPLTMISGPVEQLCESNDINKHDKQLLGIINRSVIRMLKLVNQLLDFNKLENDTLQLHVKPTDIIAELARIMDIFLMNAEEKGITLTCHGMEGSYLILLDVDKLEKIINNLMSNALKFTQRGGKIDVSLDTQSNGNGEQWIKITVADSGKGIPQSELKNIFKRYYQLNNQSEGTINWGTGIGLYYARSLAVLHHGDLVASNQSTGQGAVFTLTLPTNEAIYSNKEKAPIEKSQEAAYPLQDNVLVANKISPTDEDDNRPKILIVDDDTEVVHYLRTLLGATYRVAYRFDAESALKAIREEEPSLILSDVVMPGMSGYELCRQIKQDSLLCHIPIILVTAKTTTESQVEGLNSGADAYVTKPFTPKVLLAMTQSLITNRDKTKTILNNATETDKSMEEVLAPQDKSFMDELYKIMEQELANSELDVNKVTELMHISRTKLYYKVKGLTGENPSVFFKTYKLNRAASLIIEGKNNISEIAYMTGFNTLSHFSTSFKKQFGCTPSEYSKKTY